ncbi:hypothetical protein D9619_002417 [Psilocybe cf. subviscida]|uniref:galacturonan 1,4-alpha-galacturonidase n=1 Tax=Psilocybe cf. subviscida TaxID=2480587 RepID=A0A8H5AY31_9AGAR|nr:hypothetical protein D9619_002417 [Psilocybe cf. subviscida]
MTPSLVQAGVLLAFVQMAFGWNTFTVPHVDGADDTPAFLAALPTYATNSTILFQQGVHYNIFTPIKFPTLNNVEIRIEGNLSYPSDIPTVQAIVGATTFPGAWFTFSGGNNVTLRGSTNPNWGWIDGKGQAWWDAMQQTNRPHGISFSKIANGVIRDMKIWKPIGWNFGTSGSSNLHAFNNKIVAVSDTNLTAKNHYDQSSHFLLLFSLYRDGFSASGTNMLFEDNHIQNGDDCLTVGSGANGIHFRNTYCEGGHGLSIGSLGKNGQVSSVQNVLIENIVMYNTLYGARFKSWTGGNGLACNVTWKNIAFTKVPFPIYVTQNYWDQGIGPKPTSGSTNNTAIQDFTFQNFVGVVQDKPYVEGSCVSDPCWYYVPGATGKEVAIFDLYPGTAKNIVAKGIFATTETHAPVAVMCNSTTISTDVGFKCWNGKFILTAAGWL